MIETSTEIFELAAALAKAQGDIKNASKDKDNSFFKSRYADLASVWDVCRKPLSENGLSIVQLPIAGDGTVGVVTTLLHASGQWMRTTMSLPTPKLTPQEAGSLITYLRRYALAGAVGVAPDDGEDDDGNAADEAAKKRGPRKKPPPKKQSTADGKTSDASAATHGNPTDGQLMAQGKAKKQIADMGIAGADVLLGKYCAAVTSGHLNGAQYNVLVGVWAAKLLALCGTEEDLSGAIIVLDAAKAAGSLTESQHGYHGDAWGVRQKTIHAEWEKQNQADSTPKPGDGGDTPH